jgi:hypothetical protein
MKRPTKRGFRRSGIAVLVATALVGCGGDHGATDGELRDGVYEFELSEAYLRGHGIPLQQARAESGVHEVTLDRGSFVDRWRAADGRVGLCVGVHALEGTRAVFRWTDGCTGEWTMTYAVDGVVVVWSDVEPLDPDAGPEERRLTKVFNGVRWTRTGDVSPDR